MATHRDELATRIGLLQQQARYVIEAMRCIIERLDSIGDDHADIATADLIRATLRTAYDIEKSDLGARKYLSQSLAFEVEKAKSPLDDVNSSFRRNHVEHIIKRRLEFVFPELGERMTLEHARDLFDAWSNARSGRPPNGSNFEGKWTVFERVWREISKNSLSKATLRSTRKGKRKNRCP